jgi:hypothetical protein
MNQVIENGFNDTSFMDGDSQLHVGVDGEALADSTEEDAARYEKVIRELDEFEEAYESSTNPIRPLQRA